MPHTPSSQANASGTVLQSEILGNVKMPVYLSGMPELRLGLNDKVHCVRRAPAGAIARRWSWRT